MRETSNERKRRERETSGSVSTPRLFAWTEGDELTGHDLDDGEGVEPDRRRKVRVSQLICEM